MAEIEFYVLPGCPFCAKVENKLQELDLDYESRQVPRSRSERDEVAEVSGQRGVPVIVDADNGVDGMYESDDIVNYLERTYGDAA